MVRRILQCLALLVLIFGGPGMGAGGTQPVQTCCCGTEAGEPSPCGMPTCPPRCPGPTPVTALHAPAPALVRVQTAAKRRLAERKAEPLPWPAPVRAARGRNLARPATPATGPPPGPPQDRQARLRCFRI
ncbi:hypothetical protein [Mesoterricola sediminis]|uniref:Uncharacterized protein n=1 Tax=Mesoterricola sediminis TaxID=2927980 RepID=A0AA48GYD7_9BACT|nr:hypothetical protein [Mesoterricola sediminis]BDU77905.1 hypothetical protein METESE_28630 [Mesoterricola sediminis]